MQVDLSTLPYSSSRQPLFATHGVVATSQPLAAQAGLVILQRGGNAVDAAIATAAALTVLEPTSNGIGGDLFALVWDGATLHGLNGSGRAPAALTVQAVRQHGHDTIPTQGWLSVTVPGAPAGWRDLHKRFGKLRFASLFEPAISYAEQGYPISVVLARNWNRAMEAYSVRTGAEFRGWTETFAPDGRAPAVGEIWRSPGHARTLRLIAETNADDFYQGSTAQAIVQFADQTGGLITADELLRHTTTWVEPISTNYRGYDVWEIPPNGQGITALIALNILEGFDLDQFPRESSQSYHVQAGAPKLHGKVRLAYSAHTNQRDQPHIG